MTEQKRILGIDYGTRRIGISISDPLRIIASSYDTIENVPALWNTLRDIIEKEGIEFVVIGMPLNLKGDKGQKAEEVQRFIEELKRHVTVDVVTWDERFTTSMAQQSMMTMGATKKQRRNAKGRIDAMAAAIMLQGFLDSTKKSMSC